MRVIETKRLVLRPFSAEDVRDFQELAVDWNAAPGPAFDKWNASKEGCEESVRELSTMDQYFAMSLRDSGKVVGLLAVNGIDEQGQADLGHVILSRYQDNDHDQEALRAMVRYCFEALNVRSIVTHNAAEHAAQLAPLKSLGFAAEHPDEAGALVLERARWTAPEQH